MQVPSFSDTLKRKKNKAILFKTVCLRQFNKNIQAIARKAGWTEIVGKQRMRQGKIIEIYRNPQKQPCRFCDLLSSHIMRRTAITTMLIAGVPEYIIRRISGHAANSHSFYRYVSYVQSYMDKEIDKMHELIDPSH